jgi:hypothetical protein
VVSEEWLDMEASRNPSYSAAQLEDLRSEWVAQATDILNVGVLCILLTAPICSFVLPRLAKPLIISVVVAGEGEGEEEMVDGRVHAHLSKSKSQTSYEEVTDTERSD